MTTNTETFIVTVMEPAQYTVQAKNAHDAHGQALEQAKYAGAKIVYTKDHQVAPRVLGVHQP